MRHLAVVIVAAVSLALAVSCITSGSAPANADPLFAPERDSDIQGTITRVDAGSGSALLRILVEERPADQGGSLKDLVTITADTQLFREKGDRLVRVSIDHLRQGAAVAVWYDGAVKESYPRQANAVAIVVVE